MTQLTVKTEGVSQVTVHLQEMPDEIRASIVRAVHGEAVRLVALLQDEVIPALPIKHGDSYRQYRESIHFEMDESGGGVMAKVGTPGVIKSSQYGEFNIAKGIEFGTAAHVIRARFAQALAFTLGDVKMFRKQVTHPGTQAYHPITGTLEREAPAIRAALSSAASEALK